METLSIERPTNARVAVVDDRAFFAFDDNVLRVTDGTAAGTRVVADLGPDANVRNLTGFEGQLLFSARDEIHGDELWTSDGTMEGTKIHRDIRSGPQSSWPTDFAVAVDQVLFTANDGVHGRELWAYEPNSPADFDENGVVDFADFLRLAENYGRSRASAMEPFLAGDVNEDDIVDFADFLILSSQFGRRAHGS